MSYIKINKPCLQVLFIFVLLFLNSSLAKDCLARIYIDINSPSVKKFKIAIPEFKNLGSPQDHPELAAQFSDIIANDLDLSGYFLPMEKEAFLSEKKEGLTLEEINFKNWSLIGAELLLKGGYTCIGSHVEVVARLYDVFWGKQIMGKRLLGQIKDHRRLMHRLGNEIIRALTGQDGIFLTKLAFVSNGTGHKEIYVSDFDGHNIVRLTFDKSIAMSPRLSPDGTRLLYNSYRDGWPVLYLRDLATGISKRLSGRKGLNIGASWSPDGKKVALTLSIKGNPDIFLIDTNGKIMKRLTSYWGIDVSPCFSPDGNKIAFVSNRSGSPQIYIKDLLTGKEQRLTYEGNYNTSPSWSRLNRIAYSSMEQGSFQICTISAEGGQPVTLTHNSGNNEDPCWSIDGRYIVFSSNRRGNYHLYIMTANGSNQRQITFMKGDQTAPSWGPEFSLTPGF